MAISWPYIVLTGILLVLFLAGFFISFKTLSQNTAKMVSTQLDTISDNAYLNITRGERICELLATDDTLQQLGKQAAISPEDLQERAQFIKRQLENVQYISSVNYTDLLLLFPGLDTAITADEIGTRREEAVRMLSDAAGQVVTTETLAGIPANNGHSVYYGGNLCVLVRSILVQNRVVAYIVLCMQLDQLVPASSQEDLILIGDPEHCIYASDPAVTQAQYQDIRNQVLADRQFSFGSRRYQANLCVFSQLQNDIIVGAPQDFDAIGMNGFRRTATGLGIACVASLAILYYIFHKRVLLPMAYLADATVQRRDQHMIRNVRNSLLMLKGQNEAAQKEIRFLIPLGIGELMQQLCNSKNEEEKLSIARRCLSLAGIPARHRFCILGLFHLEDAQDTFKEMAGRNAEVTPIFVLNNLMTDLMFTSGVMGAIAVVDQFYIVLASCEDGQGEEYFSNILQKLDAFYKRNYHVTIATTKPRFGESAADLGRQAGETMNDLLYLDFWYKERVQSGNVPSNSLLPYLKSLRNLIGRLDEKDWSGAREIFQKIMEDLPAEPQNLQIAKYRVYGIIDVLLAAIIGQDNALSNNALHCLDYDRGLYRINNIKDFRAQTEEIFARIIQLRQDTAQDTNNSTRMEQVQQYVAQHYCESDLTVSGIADAFGISVAYLSREYKKHWKVNLNDQIQQLRVEKAKELLHTQSVKNAATMSGFSDYQALVRTFKKLEGITPNEYKKILLHGEDNSEAPSLSTE